MKTAADAEALAAKLTSIGQLHGKSIASIISNMEQPLGRFVGNSLEIEECLSVLKGEKIYGCSPQDFSDMTELTLELCAHMIHLGKQSETLDDARKRAQKSLDSGEAYEYFCRLCKEQGGDLAKLPKASHTKTILASQSGFLKSYNTEQIGMASLVLGAGRIKTSDIIDPVAGLQLHKKVGDPIEVGEPLFTMYASQSKDFDKAEARLAQATEFSLQKPQMAALIHKSIVANAT